MTLAVYLARRRRVVERGLSLVLPASSDPLRRAMRYSLLAGGKRIRPILTLAAAELGGVSVARALPFACAVEMVHTYSLVHDDLPAMDDDDVRRGRPTSHRKFGEATAILAGDALLTAAFGVMAGARRVAPERTVAAVAAVARAAGDAGMCGGQALDLAAAGRRSTRARVERIHRRKTGALFVASVDVGAIVAGMSAPGRRRLREYGAALGLCFQVADDIEDAGQAGDGRTDAALGKATYPGVLGMDGAMRQACEARDAAIAALRPFGVRADPLRAMAAYIVDRVASA